MRRDNDDKTFRHGDQLASTARISAEQRVDALRAVAFEQALTGRPIAEVREIVQALGLVEVDKRTEDEPVERAALLAAMPFPDRVVRCPDCNALPGAPCTVRDGTRAYTAGHVARHRKAEERS